MSRRIECCRFRRSTVESVPEDEAETHDHRPAHQRHRDGRGPSVLAARMRHVPGWHDLARPALVFGALFVAVLVTYAVLEGKPGGGYLQRAAIVLLSVGVVTLAVRVKSLAGSPAVDGLIPRRRGAARSS